MKQQLVVSSLYLSYFYGIIIFKQSSNLLVCIYKCVASCTCMVIGVKISVARKQKYKTS